MKKRISRRISKLLILVMLPVVTFLTLGILMVQGLTSGVVWAVTKENGGMFYVGSNSKMKLNGTKISGNTAENGGGIFVDKGGELTIGDENDGTIYRYDENGNEDPNGKYVYFGSYPQTVKSDDVTIEDEENVDENGYYLGSDGNKYAKVEASPLMSSYVFSDGTAVTNGTTYYFKVEPIKWRILGIENGEALLLCEEVIEAKVFNTSLTIRTINGTTIYPNNYKFSDLRAWLNGYAQEEGNTTGEDYSSGGFLQKAFTSDEQNLILTTEVDNSASTSESSSNPYCCENTNDKIFLLSYQDMINSSYGFASEPNTFDEARRKSRTDYSTSKGLFYYNNSNGSASYQGMSVWFLRTPNHLHAVKSGTEVYEYVYCVESVGKVFSGDDELNTQGFGVAPSLKISASSLSSRPIISGNTATSGNGSNIYNAGTLTINGGVVGEKIEEVEENQLLIRVDKNGNKDSNGEYVLFGSYPQTIKAGNVTIIDEENADEDGYYLGSDGEKYYKYSSGDYVSNYLIFSNGEKIAKNTNYYFKVEPLMWRILDIYEDSEGNEKALLFCEDAIDAHNYYTKVYAEACDGAKPRTINGKTIYATNYKYSNIRSWLNGYAPEQGNESYGEDWSAGGFLQKAFTVEEQSIILTTEVDNSSESTELSSNSRACENTFDKVFLMSYQDMLKSEYGFKSSDVKDLERVKKQTDYSRIISLNNCNYNDLEKYFNTNYYLRSPYYEYVTFVDGGYATTRHTVGNDYSTVPALNIDASVLQNSKETDDIGDVYNLGTLCVSGGVIEENINNISSGIFEMQGGEIKKNIFGKNGTIIKLYGGIIDGTISTEGEIIIGKDFSYSGVINLGKTGTVIFEEYDGSQPSFSIVLDASRGESEVVTLEGYSGETTNILSCISRKNSEFYTMYGKVKNSNTVLFLREKFVNLTISNCTGPDWNKDCAFYATLHYKINSGNYVEVNEAKLTLKANDYFSMYFFNDGSAGYFQGWLTNDYIKNLSNAYIGSEKGSSVSFSQVYFTLTISFIVQYAGKYFDVIALGDQTRKEEEDIVIKFVNEESSGAETIIGTSIYENGETIANVDFLPTKEGFEFSGWFDENGVNYEEYIGQTVSSEIPTIFYAHWTLADYMVTFDLNATAGSFENETDATKYVASGSAIGTLPEPSRPNYNFAGWYTEKTGGDKITEKTIVTADVTYYAHWTKQTVTFPSSWKSQVASTDYMTITITPSNITSIEFLSSPGSKSSLFGTLSSGISVYGVGTDIEFVSPKDIIAPTDSSSLFESLTSLTFINFSNFSTSGVTNMNSMFNDCRKLTTLSNLNFNTVMVTDMGSMFFCCSALTSLNFANNLSNVKDVSHMFGNCTSLSSLTFTETVSFSEFKINDMEGMFINCSSLTSLKLTGFYITKVTTMENMFYGCKKLTTLDLGKNFYTSQVTNMYSMFENCSSLTSLNLNTFNTSKVTNMSRMFYNCSSLTKITYGSDFVIGSSASKTNMYYGCTSLSDSYKKTFAGGNIGVGEAPEISIEKAFMEKTFDGAIQITAEMLDDKKKYSSQLVFDEKRYTNDMIQLPNIGT